MSQKKLDGQREIVKNERRERVENAPYGAFWETAYKALYPAGHPYSWTTIGSMDDLSAATLEDVNNFFRTYYTPNNAVLTVAGDVTADQVRQLTEKYFAWIPRGQEVRRPDIPVPAIPETRRITLEDRVTLPQVNLVWRTVKAYDRDEAALTALGSLLSEGKNSRLYKRLVYEQQVAQSVSAGNESQLLSGDFFVRIMGKPGGDLRALERAVDEEVAKIAATPPTAEELSRVVSGIETAFVASLETVGGKADQLNGYTYYTGSPDFAGRDIARFRALTPADVQRAAQQYLAGRNRIVIDIVPRRSAAAPAAAGKENAR